MCAKEYSGKNKLKWLVAPLAFTILHCNSVCDFNRFASYFCLENGLTTEITILNIQDSTLVKYTLKFIRICKEC